MSERGESRRDFFRRLLARHPEEAAPRQPPIPPAPPSATLRVPDDQRDIADALVRLGRLERSGDGVLTETREMGGYLAAAKLGSAAAIWLDRVRSGRPLDPEDENEAHTLRTLRSQIERLPDG